MDTGFAFPVKSAFCTEDSYSSGTNEWYVLGVELRRGARSRSVAEFKDVTVNSLISASVAFCVTSRGHQVCQSACRDMLWTYARVQQQQQLGASINRSSGEGNGSTSSRARGRQMVNIQKIQNLRTESG